MPVREIFVADRRARTYLNRLETFLGGEEVVENKLQKVNRHLSIATGLYRENWVVPRTIWWKGLEAARDELRRHGSLREAITPIMEYPIQTATKLSFLHKTFSDQRRKELSSRITSANVLEPVIFEIDTAAHFMQLAWFEAGIRPGERTPEFIASLGKIDIEVECKAKQSDSGRMVERAVFYRLVDKLLPILIKERRSGQVVLTVPKRLPKHDKWFKQAENTLREAIRDQKNSALIADGAYYQFELNPAAGIAVGKSDFTKMLTPDKEHTYSHYAFSGESRGDFVLDPIIFRLDSEKKDTFLDDVLESLVDANSQFTRKRASVISCFLPEIESFEGVQTDSALRDMTGFFFDGYAHQCVYAVTFTSEYRRVVDAHIINSDMPALTFYNPKYQKNLGEEMPIYGKP